MLTIRLQRVGKKNHPAYRLVIAEKARDTQGDNMETLGNYDPHKKENGFQPNTERINYWVSKGAQMSNTVHNLLLKAGIVKDAKPMRSVYISKTRAIKLAEKKKSEHPAQSAPAPAAPEAPAVPATAPEAPAATEPAATNESSPQ